MPEFGEAWVCVLSVVLRQRGGIGGKMRYFDPELLDWVEFDPEVPEDFDTLFFLPIWDLI